VTIRHLMSCRGWSSDAYWAARITTELDRAGHQVALVCKRGTEARVIDRARGLGAPGLDTLRFQSGLHPASDVADLRQLLRWLPSTDVLHVHRGKEHWLAALANRFSGSPRPLFRTRHIVQPVQPHPMNRWLYGTATTAVVAVTEAIRRQYVAAELMDSARVVTLPGGVDLRCFHPGVDGARFRAQLGVPDGVPLIGLLAGLRVMKGHGVVLEAAAELARRGRAFHLVLAGRGHMEGQVRQAVAEAGLGDRVSLPGFIEDLPAAIAAFDVALYPPLESEGMSRVLFEYLATGRAIVASRVGVVPEVLRDGESALLVPAAEPRPLADAIDRLLGDRALRAGLGAAAAALCAARLSGARVAERLAELYDAAVPAARTRGQSPLLPRGRSPLQR